MKPDYVFPDIWQRGEPHARRNLTIEYQRPWWFEFIEGIAGYVVIGILLVGIIVFWPAGTA